MGKTRPDRTLRGAQAGRPAGPQKPAGRAPALETELRDVVRELTGGASIRRDTPLFESGLIDSLKVLDLVVAIEKRIGRRIRDEEIRLESFRTIAAIVETFGLKEGRR